MHQAVKVSAYIESLPDIEREISMWLRELIFNEVAGVEEKFSFGIPFYHYFGMFCYITHNKKAGGIELVFCRGKDLVLAYPELETKGRAMVAGLFIKDLKDYPHGFIKNLIQSAAAWQLEARQTQKPFVSKKRRNKN